MREEFYENSAGPQNERTQKLFYKFYQVMFVLAVVVLVISLYFCNSSTLFILKRLFWLKC